MFELNGSLIGELLSLLQGDEALAARLIELTRSEGGAFYGRELLLARTLRIQQVVQVLMSGAEPLNAIDRSRLWDELRLLLDVIQRDLEAAPLVTLDAPTRAALQAMEQMAAAQGWPVAVAIVSPDGLPVAQARYLDPQLGSVPIALGKARTALAQGVDTSQIQAEFYAAIQDKGLPQVRATAADFQSRHQWPMEGGVVVRRDDGRVWAIGVSGVHSSQDAQVARAGAEALQAVSTATTAGHFPGASSSVTTPRITTQPRYARTLSQAVAQARMDANLPTLAAGGYAVIVGPWGTVLAETGSGTEATRALARARARTAYDFRRPTQVFADNIAQGLPEWQRFLAVPGLALDPGGVPIVVDGHVVAAVGVAYNASDVDSAQATVTAEQVVR